MGMSMEDYYADVREERNKILKVLAERPGLQPVGQDWLYASTVKNRMAGTIAGVIVELSLKANAKGICHASRLFVDGTHELATDEQISAHLKIHEQRREEMFISKQRRETGAVTMTPPTFAGGN
jgi:hypothetical protein